jgi:hypothetical protein
MLLYHILPWDAKAAGANTPADLAEATPHGVCTVKYGWHNSKLNAL